MILPKEAIITQEVKVEQEEKILKIDMELPIEKIDENLFKAVKVSFDSIEWPNEADIDPETLYEDSISYSN